ncbi:protein takeout-like [Epargyreus clarus]|uniref:protein takeout-like n=1 Tax=Epargyreus clarus TaxID=520877 RepID=UPI003C2AE78C
MAVRKLLAVTAMAVICFSDVGSVSVRKCKSDDHKCARQSAQELIPVIAAGIPEYQMEALDPIKLKKIDASSPNLRLIVRDVIVTGIKDCTAKKIKRDKSKNNIFLQLLCSCQVEGQYEMKGQLLILPMEGKGPVHVTLRKAEFNVNLDVTEVKKGDVPYIEIKGWKHTFNLKDKSDVVFDNLFNGNEVLAQAAREVISQSGNEIILEVGGPVIKAVIDSILHNIEKFFSHIPIEDLALD